MEDRRRFSRIEFNYPATLTGPEASHSVTVLDLSLNGALLELGPQWHGGKDTPYTLEIALSETARVTMQVRLAHREGHRGGFVCQQIDLESLMHLRRLAELNLGDTEVLQRELGELLSQATAPE